MKNFETLGEIEDVLASYAPSRMTDAVYSLERVSKLLSHIGNPQDMLKIIHIAGTSGKTSTTYFIRSILEAAGKKVGLTASPHIESIRERVQIYGGPISEEEFIRYFNDFYALVLDSDSNTTYFEIMTAFAYWVFNKEQVDYAVIEVGLGGRFDATNTVNRPDKVCVINSIGFDHTDILGDTLAEIANEKAGIIQGFNRVFTVPQEGEVRVVIENEACKKHADLTVITPTLDPSSEVPVFQQHNFQLALAAARYVADRDALQLPDTVEALGRSIAVPGRYETYSIGEKTVVLDGAHNPQKLGALIDVLAHRYKEPAVVVAGLSEAPTKKVVECVRLLSNFAARVLYTTFAVQRDVTRYSVRLDAFSDFKRAQDETIEQPKDALERALLGDERLIVVTGSLYLVSIVRPFVRERAGLSD
jgi:dihydrofolate synthase/folylpolyglutamate synthase